MRREVSLSSSSLSSSSSSSLSSSSSSSPSTLSTTLPSSSLYTLSSESSYSAASELRDEIIALLRSETSYKPAFAASGTCTSPRSVPSSGSKRRSSSWEGDECGNDNDESRSPPTVPHDEWRARIADWSYRVVDHFRYDREVVSVSMNYFDRFLFLTSTCPERAASESLSLTSSSSSSSSSSSLSKSGLAALSNGYGYGHGHGYGSSPTSSSTCAEDKEEVDSRTYQLAAMTSLYLAVKLHGEQPEENSSSAADPSSAASSTSSAQQPPPENRRKRRRRRRLRLLSFVELSRGQFNADDITGMEKRMLTALRWRVNPPTPMVFVSYLLRLLPSQVPAQKLPQRRRAHRRYERHNTFNSHHHHHHQRHHQRHDRNAADYSAPTARSVSRYGMPEEDYLEVVREEQAKHDLVLHILHELSRYLAELSVCLSDVSAVHDPSRLAFAAILVSSDCLTDEALPSYVRDAFLADAANLCPKLTRDDPDVAYLVRRMREAFLPELLLDGSAGSSLPSTTSGSACVAEGGTATSSSSSSSPSEGTGHPIAIAREAGLLDVEALYGPAPIPAPTSLVTPPPPPPSSSPTSTDSSPSKSSSDARTNVHNRGGRYNENTTTTTTTTTTNNNNDGNNNGNFNRKNSSDDKLKRHRTNNKCINEEAAMTIARETSERQGCATRENKQSPPRLHEAKKAMLVEEDEYDSPVCVSRHVVVVAGVAGAGVVSGPAAAAAVDANVAAAAAVTAAATAAIVK